MTLRARAIGALIGTALSIVGLAGVACVDMDNFVGAVYSGVMMGGGVCLAICAAFAPRSEP